MRFDFRNLLSAVCLSILMLRVPASAQTPAQKALAAEPEILKINAASNNFQEQQAIPKNRIDSPSPGQTIISGYVGIKGSQILLRQLHDRLERYSARCGFCSRWQDELAELMREQVASQVASDAIFKLAQDASGSSTQGLAALFGTAGSGTHWQDQSIAFTEMQAFHGQHCPHQGDSATLNSAQNVLCRNRYEDAVAIHNTKWAACFRDHDWVATDGQRQAYQKCMLNDDFVTQLCQQSGKADDDLCLRLTHIDIGDVLPLRNYKAPAGSIVAKDDQKAARLATVRRLNVLQLSEKTPLRNTIRGYLDLDSNGRKLVEEQIAILKTQNQQTLRCGYVSSDPSFQTNILVTFWYDTAPVGLDAYLKTIPNHPFANLGRSGRTVCPATAEQADQLQQQSKDYAASLQSTSGSSTPVVVGTRREGPAVGSYPNAGAQPADVVRGKGFTKGSNAAISTSANSLRRHIEQSTLLNLDVLDAIDLVAIQKGTLFHAKLLVDTPPAMDRHANTYTLPAGTDIYLKAVEGNRSLRSETITISVDHVVLPGQNLHVSTHPWTRPISLPQPTPQPWGAGRNGVVPGLSNLQLPHTSDTRANQIVLDAHTKLNLITTEDAPVPDTPTP